MSPDDDPEIPHPEANSAREHDHLCQCDRLGIAADLLAEEQRQPTTSQS